MGDIKMTWKVVAGIVLNHQEEKTMKEWAMTIEEYESPHAPHIFTTNSYQSTVFAEQLQDPQQFNWVTLEWCNIAPTPGKEIKGIGIAMDFAPLPNLSGITNRALWSVTAGRHPNAMLPALSRQWSLTSEESAIAHQHFFTTYSYQAARYFEGLLNPQQQMWARLDWIYY